MKMDHIKFTIRQNSPEMTTIVLYGMVLHVQLKMTYNSISEDYGNGGNYISSLKPGESIQVNMAWIVNENDLNNMYLSLNGDGATYEFSDSMLKTGLVDIYQ